VDIFLTYKKKGELPMSTGEEEKQTTLVWSRTGERKNFPKRNYLGTQGSFGQGEVQRKKGFTRSATAKATNIGSLSWGGTAFRITPSEDQSKPTTWGDTEGKNKPKHALGQSGEAKSLFHKENRL